MALFNIAISGKAKWKNILITSAFVVSPFIIAYSLNNLVGNTTNIFNIKYDVWCDCSQSYKTWWCGYIYMILSLPFIVFFTIKNKGNVNKSSEWLKDYLREMINK
jgi:hypothetical protein